MYIFGRFWTYFESCASSVIRKGTTVVIRHATSFSPSRIRNFVSYFIHDTLWPYPSVTQLKKLMLLTFGHFRPFRAGILYCDILIGCDVRWLTADWLTYMDDWQQHNRLLFAVREIRSRCAVQVLPWQQNRHGHPPPTGLLYNTDHALFHHHCRHHHHHSHQTTPRRPVASEFYVISVCMRQRNRSDKNAGGDVCSVHSLPGPKDHGSDRFVRGARVQLHWPLLQPRLPSVERHAVFFGLELFLQLLHLL